MIRWDNEGRLSPLPLVGVPTSAGANGIEPLIEWARANRRALQERLLLHGALLFRGFEPASPDQFANFVRSLSNGHLLDYIGGASPRKIIAPSVFTSTETDEHYKISQHHEGAYLRHMPRFISFLCVVPAEAGGETPLADSRRVQERLPPQLVARFASAGVRYINNLANGFGIGKSWQEQFQTENPAEVESRLRADGYVFEWKPDGGLRTSLTCPAMITHAVSGERVWIAQADHWHPSGLTGDVRTRLGKILPESEFPMNAVYGDGKPISEDDLEETRCAMRAEMRIFEWRAGDLLFCDNHLVSHGRLPYTGPRRVLVALADPGKTGGT